MPRGLNRFCFVPSCKSGLNSAKKKNKAEGKRNPSLFAFPKDPVLCAKWINRIKRLDRDPTENDKVCELHFQKEFILHFFETQMPDGTVNRIERTIPALKPGAIPSIFPNHPKYMNTAIKIRKPPMERKSYRNAQKQLTAKPATEYPYDPIEIDNFSDTNGEPSCSIVAESEDNMHSDDVPVIIDTTVIVNGGQNQQSESGHIEESVATAATSSESRYSLSAAKAKDEVPCESTSNNLPVVDMLTKLKMPQGWCKIHLPSDMCMIMWIDKTDDYNVTKRVLVDCNGNVKVYIGLVHVTVEGYENLTTAKEILRLLDIIKPMLVCEGAFNRIPEGKFLCRGYHFKGARCVACSTNRNTILRKNSKPNKTTIKLERKTKALVSQALFAIERADLVMGNSNKDSELDIMICD